MIELNGSDSEEQSFFAYEERCNYLDGPLEREMNTSMFKEEEFYRILQRKDFSQRREKNLIECSAN